MSICLPRWFIGILLGAGSVIATLPAPSHAQTLTWHFSAEVTAPTSSSVQGGWVTPHGTLGPSVSPGANITFQSKHSIWATYTPNTLNFGKRQFCAWSW
ncbi:MAG: hypothetical protein OHK0029_23560 [Armatimonadaceae bacterium]